MSAEVHYMKITVKQGTYLHSCLCIVNHAADYGGSRFSSLTQKALCMCPDSTQQDAQPEDEDWLYVKKTPTELCLRQMNASELCSQSG